MLFKRLLCTAAATLFISTGMACGQTDFFLSFNDLNQGATNSDAVASFSPGDAGSLYLYWSTNGPANSNIDTGAFVDLQTSLSGVIEFTAAETFDFDVLVLGSVLGPRWGDSFGAAASVNLDLVDELSAFTIFSGLGIDEMHNGALGATDQGYDSGADAFLFGRIDFVVTSEPTANSVDITMQEGNGGIVNAGAFITATFGMATIEVESGPLLGDVNQDGEVDMTDISPFVDILINREFLIEADINEDGAVDLLDVRPFVNLL